MWVYSFLTGVPKNQSAALDRGKGAFELTLNWPGRRIDELGEER